MARKIKDKYLVSKVTGSFKANVDTYAEETERTVSDLIRVALLEYIQNHPAHKGQ